MIIKNCLLTFALTAGLALAAPITGLINTGAGLGAGVTDPNWQTFNGATLLGQSVTISTIPGTYLPNTTDSRWIWENSNGLPVNVTRDFVITFDLTGFLPSTATLSGRWATDNAGDDILINGVSTGQTSPGFTGWTNFSVNSGFVAGVNTLTFRVRDVGVVSGFRAEFLQSNAEPDTGGAIPEPSTWLLIAGAVALIISRRPAI